MIRRLPRFSLLQVDPTGPITAIPMDFSHHLLSLRQSLSLDSLDVVLPFVEQADSLVPMEVVEEV